MPAKSPAALARRRERHAEWTAARRLDPVYRERCNAPRRTVATGPRPKGKPKLKRVLDAPFIGCDGEATTDPVTGEHRYCLFRMGDRELYDGGRRLTTPELLQFIVDHPDPHDYLIGFFFDYDINCILRDIQRERDPAKPDTPSRLERLLAIDIAEWDNTPEPARHSFWTWLNFDGYREFGVKVIARNFIKVCHGMADPKRGGRRIADPTTVRTIEDVSANFQSSFVKAIEAWSVGDSGTAQQIKRMKKQRAQFATITPEIRAYNAAECILLADMMERFRRATLDAGITPRTWNGAGKLGAAMLDAAQVMRRKDYEEKFPDGLRTMARDSYYGGRFETTRAGLMARAVYAFDIRSAFPAAMVELPCLVHGRFIRASASTLRQAQGKRSSLFVCPVRFTHPRTQFLCGLPIRSKKGPISWPRSGSGVYWSPEIRSAKRLGAKVELLGGWLFEKRCDCRPFDFIREKFLERQKLDLIAKMRGTPLKLAINATYGKQAQRVGGRTWAIHVHAALITAITRARINDAIRSVGQHNVVMIAADALFTVNKKPAGKVGSGLGQWDAKVLPGLFIVQPGLYWTPDAAKLKTRGVSAKFFVEYLADFRAAWRGYLKHYRLGLLHPISYGLPSPPWIGVEVNVFVSLRLAYRLKNPKLGATFIWHRRKISFAWGTKRCLQKLDGDAALLGPLDGDRDAWSYTYDEQGKRVLTATLDDHGQLIGATDMLASDQRLIMEAMPDPLDMGPPIDE